jgi:DNA-binding MarR family transcriptional regulator
MARRTAPLPFTLRIAITNAWVSQLFDAELEKRGVAPFQAGTLMVIHREEPVTPSGLHQVMGVPFTTMRNRVNELVRDGLVERTPNPDDGRSHLLRTTPRGAELVREGKAAARQVQRLLERHGVDVAAGLTDELDTLREVTKGLVAGRLGTGRQALTTGPW